MYYQCVAIIVEAQQHGFPALLLQPAEDAKPRCCSRGPIYFRHKGKSLSIFSRNCCHENAALESSSSSVSPAANFVAWTVCCDPALWFISQQPYYCHGEGWALWAELARSAPAGRKHNPRLQRCKSTARHLLWDEGRRDQRNRRREDEEKKNKGGRGRRWSGGGVWGGRRRPLTHLPQSQAAGRLTLLIKMPIFLAIPVYFTQNTFNSSSCFSQSAGHDEQSVIWRAV